MFALGHRPQLRCQVTWPPAFAGVTFVVRDCPCNLRHSRGGGNLVHRAIEVWGLIFAIDRNKPAPRHPEVVDEAAQSLHDLNEH